MNIGTKRTTERDYEADLKLAQAWFAERTAFLYDSPTMEPEEHDLTWKSINNTLNNEWEEGIAIDTWVQRVMDRLGVKGSA